MKLKDLFKLKVRKQDKDYLVSSYNEETDVYIDWIQFLNHRNIDISYELCGYFDNRPRIRISLYFFHAVFILPFPNKWTDECSPPKWGIAIHNNIFWIYTGGKGNMHRGINWCAWNLPFFTNEWIRTSIMLKDGSWEHETPKIEKDFYLDEWTEKKKSWLYDYTDKYDGSIIPTTIYLKQYEWRPKWLTWTKAFAKISTIIDIHFSQEVGKGKGSWKGGTIGCSYDLLPNETPIDCIKRMEKERTF